MSEPEMVDLLEGVDNLLRIRTDGPAGIQAGDLLGIREQTSAEPGQVVVVATETEGVWTVRVAPVEGAEIKGRVVWLRRDLP